jgi:4-amino-4-deoxy-L-arabinose transferase-like glycosyltransferase
MLNAVKLPKWLSPPRMAFLASLLLSLIAVAGTVTVGKDAARYLYISQEVIRQTPAVAFELFTWPWFSLLLAITHHVSGVSLELAAYLWCAFLMAGTCALLVSITQRYVTDGGYWACLVVLSIPAFNHLRSDIIREFGFWFFCALALWLMLSWLERGGWLRATLVQLAVAMAALFRIEAVFLFPVLALSLLGDLNTRQGWLKLFQITLFLLAGIMTVLFLLISGYTLSQPRVDYVASLIDPRIFLERFNLMTGKFAEVALEKYSKDDAREIVFFGLLLTLITNFIALCGPLTLPFLYRPTWRAVIDYWRQFRPLAWAWLLYFCMLLIFFVQERFINSRYVSFLNLLAVPVLTMALISFAKRFPRLGKVVIILALLVMLHNVVSFTPEENALPRGSRLAIAKHEPCRRHIL